MDEMDSFKQENIFKKEHFTRSNIYSHVNVKMMCCNYLALTKSLFVIRLKKINVSSNR